MRARRQRAEEYQDEWGSLQSLVRAAQRRWPRMGMRLHGRGPRGCSTARAARAAQAAEWARPARWGTGRPSRKAAHLEDPHLPQRRLADLFVLIRLLELFDGDDLASLLVSGLEHDAVRPGSGKAGARSTAGPMSSSSCRQRRGQQQLPSPGSGAPFADGAKRLVVLHARPCSLRTVAGPLRGEQAERPCEGPALERLSSGRRRERRVNRTS